jgi:hypothetical protein
MYTATIPPLQECGGGRTLPADLPRIYNPSSQTPEELINNFVVRIELFRDIFGDIKNSEMKHPEQHYIIQGIRGQGKTTLLLRIAYEINNDKKLRQKTIPVIFNEEQHNISRLFKLWETTAEYLEEYKEAEGLLKSIHQLEDDEDYERRCFQLLETNLKTNGKKIILFIDNIDEMLYKFSQKEHHRLREIFMESAELRVIGTSSVSLEFHHKYDKPFYQFFQMPTLKGLTTKETQTLLLKLGEYYKRDRVKEIVETQPGRIEALRRISGGVIRAIIILFQIFVDDQNGNAFRDLEIVLDNVTPLYQHRMAVLSPQQQEIVDCIALNWDAVTTKEISLKTRLESKAVSAQLKQLEKYHIIENVKTSTKNYLYRIQERFFNIWYLMRHGRKWDEKRVRFLVEFFQIWFDEKEHAKRALQHLESFKYTKEAFNQQKEPRTALAYAMLLIWNNEMEKIHEVSKIFLNEISLESLYIDIAQFLLFLIAKKQYFLALKLFNENQYGLKDRFKPVYYALMYFLNDEYPNEYRKMGGELQETVNEIVELIGQLEKDYQ